MNKSDFPEVLLYMWSTKFISTICQSWTNQSMKAYFPQILMLDIILYSHVRNVNDTIW